MRSRTAIVTIVGAAVALLLGAASAQAGGVHVGIHIGLPFPVPPVAVVTPPPVVMAPPPVVYGPPPVVYGPPPVVYYPSPAIYGPAVVLRPGVVSVGPPLPVRRAWWRHGHHGWRLEKPGKGHYRHD